MTQPPMLPRPNERGEWNGLAAAAVASTGDIETSLKATATDFKKHVMSCSIQFGD